MLSILIVIKDFLKRATDIIVGTTALIVFLPIMAICAIIVKTSSHGDLIYCQTRIGRYGKPFRMYKLRTMRDDAEIASGAVWATENDPRVIKQCRWMRLSHVDELPQLINVIKGDMSLVGPRPERLEILIDVEIDDRCKILKRLDVKPGITGLAQIRIGYTTNNSSFRRKLNYDIIYINRRNFFLDIWLMFKTFPKFHDSRAC